MWCPALKRASQRFDRNGLRHESVDARSVATCVLAFHCVRRHRNEGGAWEAALGLLTPDRLRQTEPVEHRHVQVEQDDVMLRFPPLYQSGRAVLRGFGRQTEKFKLTQDHFEVDGMIVDDQQAAARPPKA